MRLGLGVMKKNIKVYKEKKWIISAIKIHFFKEKHKSKDKFWVILLKACEHLDVTIT